MIKQEKEEMDEIWKKVRGLGGIKEQLVKREGNKREQKLKWKG